MALKKGKKIAERANFDAVSIDTSQAGKFGTNVTKALKDLKDSRGEIGAVKSNMHRVKDKLLPLWTPQEIRKTPSDTVAMLRLSKNRNLLMAFNEEERSAQYTEDAKTTIQGYMIIEGRTDASDTIKEQCDKQVRELQDTYEIPDEIIEILDATRGLDKATKDSLQLLSNIKMDLKLFKMIGEKNLNGKAETVIQGCIITRNNNLQNPKVKNLCNKYIDELKEFHGVSDERIAELEEEATKKPQEVENKINNLYQTRTNPLLIDIRETFN